MDAGLVVTLPSRAGELGIVPDKLPQRLRARAPDPRLHADEPFTRRGLRDSVSRRSRTDHIHDRYDGDLAAVLAVERDRTPDACRRRWGRCGWLRAG